MENAWWKMRRIAFRTQRWSPKNVLSSLKAIFGQDFCGLCKIIFVVIEGPEPLSKLFKFPISQSEANILLCCLALEIVVIVRISCLTKCIRGWVQETMFLPLQMILFLITTTHTGNLTFKSHLYRKGLKALYLTASLAFRQPLGHPNPSVFYAEQRVIGAFLNFGL